ncbi:MAG: hypothetical protein QOJ09_2753 [Actinomycetota bacterium]|nr:hypothetical protein [Actinomycetota bacterium]
MVDGNNVRGATPDGWWRDRPGAMHRLFDRLRCYRQTIDEPIVLVLDVPQDDLPEGDHDGVGVLHARRRGRDAADDRILELLDSLPGERVEVVTSDRGLANAAGRPGVEVVGSGAFLARLDGADC